MSNDRADGYSMNNINTVNNDQHNPAAGSDASEFDGFDFSNYAQPAAYPSLSAQPKMETYRCRLKEGPKIDFMSGFTMIN